MLGKTVQLEKYTKKFFGDTGISLTGVLKLGKTNFFQEWGHVYLMQVLPTILSILIPKQLLKNVSMLWAG